MPPLDRDDADSGHTRALLAGQNRALQLAVAGAPLRSILEELAATAEAQAEARALASILLLDDAGQRLYTGAAPSLPADYNRAIDGIQIGPGVGSCGTAAFEGRVTIVTDIRTDPLWVDFRELAAAHGLVACWSSPVKSSTGAVLGTFAVYHREPRSPSLRDRETVELLANTAAVVIERHLEARERARAAHALRQQARMLAEVAAASRAINASLSIEEVAATLTEQARRIIGTHQAVSSLTVNSDWAQAINAVSLSDKYAAYRDYNERPRGEGIYAEVCRTNEPMRLTQDELERHPAWRGFGSQSGRHPPMRGYLAVPLIGTGGRNLGLIQMSDKYEGEFTAGDEAILVQLASTASVGIENGYLYRSLQEVTERVTLATDAGGLGLFTWDMASDTVAWHNDRPYEQLGLPRDEAPVNARRFAEAFLHPDDVPLFAQSVEEARRGASRFQFQGRIRRPDGQLRWVEFTGQVQHGERDGDIRIVGTTADITQRKEAEAALMEREERLRQLANTIPNLAWMANPDGWITWYNDRWYDYTGTTPEEMAGWGWRSVHDPQMLPQVLQRWTESIRSGQPFEMTFPLRGKDGVYRPFFTRIAPLRDSRGEIVQWFGTNTDVSPLKKAEDELREADRRKDEFLAMLAHELRNPLAPVRTAAELLARQEGVGPGVLRASQIISRQVAHMSGLLNDLLDVSRVTRGLVEIDKAAVDLAEVCVSAVEQVRPAIDGRGHMLSVVGATPGACIVNGSALRLTQVVANLLDNAAKYTAPGGRIELSVHEEANDAVIAVQDNGQGLSSAFMTRLFQPFSQAQRGVDGARGGLGLGLAIVKGLIDLHGGTVRASSGGPGQGSCFEIRLPRLAASRASAPIVVPVSAPAPAAMPLDVLIVDDNVDAADTLVSFLAASGHRPQAAYNGSEALDLVRAHRFDAAFLDIDLPDISGFELAQHIRAVSPNLTALFALSGIAQPNDRSAAVAAGFKHHFVKPVEPDLLLAALRSQ